LPVKLINDGPCVYEENTNFGGLLPEDLLPAVLSFNSMDIDKLTETIIGFCIKIHSRIGPGCLERVYEEVLYYELIQAGFMVERQVSLPIEYERLYIKRAFRLDLLVENKLVIELKAVFPLPPVYFDQVRTHLVLTNLRHGMLINFKVPLMKEGIHRVFNNNVAE
jgi:GxxExxY protein